MVYIGWGRWSAWWCRLARETCSDHGRRSQSMCSGCKRLGRELHTSNNTKRHKPRHSVSSSKHSSIMAPSQFKVKGQGHWERKLKKNRFSRIAYLPQNRSIYVKSRPKWWAPRAYYVGGNGGKLPPLRAWGRFFEFGGNFCLAEGICKLVT